MSIRYGNFLYECPSCQGDVLEVQVLAFASIAPKGLSLIRTDGFTELDDGARMRCRSCGKEAELHAFVASKQRGPDRRRAHA